MRLEEERKSGYESHIGVCEDKGYNGDTGHCPPRQGPLAEWWGPYSPCGFPIFALGGSLGPFPYSGAFNLWELVNYRNTDLWRECLSC